VVTNSYPSCSGHAACTGCTLYDGLPVLPGHQNGSLQSTGNSNGLCSRDTVQPVARDAVPARYLPPDPDTPENAQLLPREPARYLPPNPDANDEPQLVARDPEPDRYLPPDPNAQVEPQLVARDPEPDRYLPPDPNALHKKMLEYTPDRSS
jgi:hypothetical protein